MATPAFIEDNNYQLSSLTDTDTSASNSATDIDIISSHKPSDKRDRKLPSQLDPALADLDEHELLYEFYKKLKGCEPAKPHVSYNNIPRFYSKAPKEESLLSLKLRDEARSRLLRIKSSQLLDNEEVQTILHLLENRSNEINKNSNDSTEIADQMLNYEEFIAVGRQAPQRTKPFFKPVIFAKLLNGDPYMRISMGVFFTYVMRKIWFCQTRIGLSIYDIQGQGYLRETDLENYILELMPTLPQLYILDKSFYSFYVCTAVRKFFFFLDPKRTGRIKIQDILASNFLDQLLELRDKDLSKQTQLSNWFSAPSALKVYGDYLALDVDRNGMLSKEELSHYGSNTLTSVFINQVFQECLTYEGEMDYKTYLDFVLAMENRKEPQALQYFFRILDINKEGYLHLFNFHYFFRGILEMPIDCGQELVKFEDIQNEIFDMVKPEVHWKITFKDLLRSGQGETVVNILIELKGFWAYENREALLQDNQDNDMM